MHFIVLREILLEGVLPLTNHAFYAAVHLPFCSQAYHPTFPCLVVLSSARVFVAKLGKRQESRYPTVIL